MRHQKELILAIRLVISLVKALNSCLIATKNLLLVKLNAAFAKTVLSAGALLAT